MASSSPQKEAYVRDQILIYVNGKRYLVHNPEPSKTVLSYLRETLGLTGTKGGCLEGGCGSCTLMVSHVDPFSGKVVHRSVNACLAPLCAMDGCAITTVEGIGNVKTGLHPIQERIAKMHGSQCGFCTPGIVMSLYAALRNNPTPTVHEIEECLDGNLCRCTGYRPILDAAKSFACCKSEGEGGAGGCAGCDCFDASSSSSSSAAACSSEPAKEAEKPRDDIQYIFPPELRKYAPQPLHLTSQPASARPSTWYRPLTLEGALEIKSMFPNAKPVVGNTELGIEAKFKDARFPVLLSTTYIPELNSISIDEDSSSMLIGSSVTLATLGSMCRKCVREMPEEKTRGCAAIVEQLKWFAGTQVRNVSSIGGNICNASPISDLNPVLCSLNAILNLVNTAGTIRQVPIRNFFLAYRKVDMKPDELLHSIRIPFTRPLEYILSFKQARRREDDIAIANAGIRVVMEKKEDTNEYVVKECMACFGGMAPTVLTARNLEKFLTTGATESGAASSSSSEGPQTWNEQTLQKACAALLSDTPLPPNVPGGQAEFRQSLCQSFFFKFFIHVSNALQINNIPKYVQSAPGLSERTVSRGEQHYTVPESAKEIVGQAHTHKSAELQASGEAKYADDIPRMPNELIAAPVLSTVPHARIVRVDPSPALEMDGVFAFIDHRDIPAAGDNKIGQIVIDEEVFATQFSTCVGTLIGLVVARDEQIAKDAAKKVKIEYEVLHPILSIQDAIREKSFYADPHSLESGNVEAVFASAKDDHNLVVVEGEVNMGGQEHFYLEPQMSIAIPGEGDEMTLISSTQAVGKTQKQVAHVLGVDASFVVCKAKRLGGGFGGKESRSIFITCAAAVAARKTGCPVRFNLDRNVDMAITGQRHPFYAKYKMAVDKTTSKLIAFDVEIYSNAGNSLDLSASIMDRALFHIDNSYMIPNLRAHGRCCKTNLPSNTAFRGFGGPQGMLICEAALEHAASAIGVRADKLREVNFYKEGDHTHYGQRIEECRLQSMWTELHSKLQYQERMQAIEAFNRDNRFKKRGLSIIPTKFGISFTAKFLNQGGALVHVYVDGTVLLTHGGIEMGQGLHTKVAAVVAHRFGIPLSKVHVAETATDKVPNSSPTAASASADIYGAAALDAANQIMARLEPLRAKVGADATFNQLVQAAYFDRINLSAQGFYITPDIGFTFVNGKGKIMDGSKGAFAYFTYGVAASEVEIDTLTGEMNIRRSDIVMDLGNSLSPAIDVGQVEGGFVQGVGWCCLEELTWGDNEHRWVRPGHLFTAGPGTYKIPAFGDVPMDFRVNLLSNAPNSFAVHSSKAVGEPPFFLGSSVFFAIKEAIYAARSDRRTLSDASMSQERPEFFFFDSPATSERIRLACSDELTLPILGEAARSFRPKGSF